jgi:hypothetical protein
VANESGYYRQFGTNDNPIHTKDEAGNVITGAIKVCMAYFLFPFCLLLLRYANWTETLDPDPGPDPRPHSMPCSYSTVTYSTSPITAIIT